MGANEFDEIWYVDEKFTTVEDLFDRAVDEALWLHGHGGYSGTLAEKSSFVMRNNGKPIPEDTLNPFVDKDGDENDKWGPAFCVPICNSMEDQEIAGYAFYGWASS